MTEAERLLIRARQWIVEEISEIGESPNNTTSTLMSTIDRYMVNTFGMELPNEFENALRWYQNDKVNIHKWRRQAVNILKNHLDESLYTEDEED